jgi:menaquinone-9 beta-reductase
LKTRYFFRVSAGAGWALIGDAGHHKDFFAGLGITDALRDARDLARAITASGGVDDVALRPWWRERDVRRIETFRWAGELGRPQRVDALKRLVATRLAHEPELAGRLGEVIDGRLSPYGLIPTDRVVRWVIAAMLRGDVRPLAPLLGVARRRAGAARELRRRERALRLAGA